MSKLSILISILLLTACSKPKVYIEVNKPYRDIGFRACGTGLQFINAHTMDTLASEYALNQVIDYTGFDTIGSPILSMMQGQRQEIASSLFESVNDEAEASIFYEKMPIIANHLPQIDEWYETRSITTTALYRGDTVQIVDYWDFVFYLKLQLPAMPTILSYTVEYERIINY